MVRPWEIIRVRQQGISDEELPVLFFIAANAGVPYGDIVNLRLRNWTWLRIALRYGLDPSIFYVPVNERISGRIYGTTYGYYMMTPRESWNRIQLTDRDIMNLVNLRFVTDYYGFAPEEVIRMRERNRDFITINNDVHVMTTRNNWGQGNNNYRDKHNIGFKYDTKRQSGNMYNGQQPNVQGRDNQGFKGKDNVNKQGSNYQDLDDKGYKQAVNQQNNRNNNNNGQNTNNQGWNNNGGNKNSRNNQGMNNQGNVQNNNQGNIPQAQAPAAQATAVVQATEAPAQATVVPAGQEQGNNNNGSKDKGNNGKRNYGVGNGNGAGNAKHPVQ
jgi:hypothetical protein